MLRKKDGNFIASATCDGSQTAILNSRTCLVAYTELRTPDFGPLLLQDDVVAKVRAMNEIGWGAYSAISSGGDTIRTEPLAPTSLITSGVATDDS
jgi:hypothetical protein